MTIEEIMNLPDIVERKELYFQQTEKFIEMIKAHTEVKDKVIISDLRGLETIYTGNRFVIYSLYPEANISCWIVSGRGGQGCSCAVGHSVLNRTSSVDVGTLMLKYGGGGHKMVGTCQFSNETMEEKIPQLLEELVALNR
jgi:nanoRNase/pAp phosphatase (c-di-AMP/oligoRNAs hydrolase)